MKESCCYFPFSQIKPITRIRFLFIFFLANSLLIQFCWLKFHRWCTHEHQIKAEIDTFVALRNCKLATEFLINLVKLPFTAIYGFLLFLRSLR